MTPPFRVMVRAVIVDSDALGSFELALPDGAEVVSVDYLPGSKSGYTAGSVVRARVWYQVREATP